MKKLFSILLVACCAALFAGCATGPAYSVYKSSIPPLAQDQGRIFFYRNAGLGAALVPDIKLNGQVIGSSQTGTFFYIDRPAGDYQVETTTEVRRTLSLTLDKNQTRFVRFDVSMGFFVGHVYPVLVENADAEAEIENCTYWEPQRQTQASTDYSH